MHRTEMYLRKDQIDGLRNLAFWQTKTGNKRIGISEIVRDAIDHWLQENKSTEMDCILSNPEFLKDINIAVKDLHASKLLSRKEALD